MESHDQEEAPAWQRKSREKAERDPGPLLSWLSRKRKKLKMEYILIITFILFIELPELIGTNTKCLGTLF